MDEGRWVQLEEGNRNLDRDREVHSSGTALAAKELQDLEKQSDFHTKAKADLESHDEEHTVFLGEKAEDEEQSAY